MRRFLRRFAAARWLGRRWYRHQRKHPSTGKPGWVTGPPDFVGVGVQKAGTTWWYELIAEHPAVSHHNRPKELHFFDELWDRDLAEADAAAYARCFARPPGLLSGEWTPGYMASFWIPAALRATAPDAKLLVLLRDPIERYRSGLTLAASNNRAPLTPMRAREAFRRGFYAEQLELVYEHFPVEQVLVLQYEQCRDEPAPHLARTYEFLGIDPSFVPPTLREERNPSWGTRVEVPEAIRRELVAAYEPDVKRLAALAPGLDLARWPSFRHLA